MSMTIDTKQVAQNLHRRWSHRCQTHGQKCTVAQAQFAQIQAQ
ncbi:MAG TPA: hypothetical protein V6D19_13305 [Stenomitos sp.]